MRRVFTTGGTGVMKVPVNTGGLSFAEYIPKPESYRNNAFNFLNLEKQYSAIGDIDWEETAYGKLWTYNLNYFDFLLQPGMDAETGYTLIDDFIKKYSNLKNAKEPYPVSLRGINWVKWLSKPDLHHTHNRQRVEVSLWQQYQSLSSNIEYHLLGNHLLENAFSLLFGAFYFADNKLFVKAKKLLVEELKEQILDDGAHFELSPMYHQIMLDRALDCINLLKHNRRFSDQDSLLDVLCNKAELMLGWLEAVSFAGGEIPIMNDSAKGIAPSTPEMRVYAQRLGINPFPVKLKESGYRMFRFANYELVTDYGQPGPDYIPGHAHADIFNFVLYINGKPVITDTGISTYNSNARRLKERSTAAHNTVMTDGREQSQVWSSFRMARRVKPFIKVDTETCVSGYYEGIARYEHEREFRTAESEIEITDMITGKIKKSEAFFHFAPEIVPEIEDNDIILPGCKITFSGMDEIVAEKYDFAEGFNRLKPAYAIRIHFKNKLQTKIEINGSTFKGRLRNS